MVRINAAAAAVPGSGPKTLRAGSSAARCSNRPEAHQNDTQQASAPLLDAVLQRGSHVQETPLHVPGHKRGRALDAGMWQLMAPAAVPAPSDPPLRPTPSSDHQQHAANPLRCDLTELEGLDYLSSPSGVIKAAQELAARAFNAQQTWFLVNGCSVAIHAAVMATVRPGQALLLARNCHLSAFAACVLSDAVPVWLQPEQDALHGIAHCVTPQQLQRGFEEAQARGLKVGAVLVVSPTYYGAVARIPELVAVCRQHGAPLLVDEAHGGHLSPLAQDLQGTAHTTPPSTAGAGGDAGPASAPGTTQLQQVPISALEGGADLVMHSTHKVLTAMTQAAMLHLNKHSAVSPFRISQALQVLQTSSPSYILLSSLDGARRHAFTPGVWHTPAAAAAAAREQLAAVPGLTLLQDGSCGAQESVLGFDLLRLVVNVQGLGLAGYDAAAWLEEQHGIVPELATNKLVVLVFGPGSTLADAASVINACRQLSAAHTVHAAVTSAVGAGTQQQQPQQALPPSGASIAALTPRQAFFADTEVVPLAEAVGRVCAELLCPYPPGVPVVFPGETLNASNIQVLQDTLAGGGVVTGGHDSTLQAVRVVVQHS